MPSAVSGVSTSSAWMVKSIPKTANRRSRAASRTNWALKSTLQMHATAAAPAARPDLVEEHRGCGESIGELGKGGGQIAVRLDPAHPGGHGALRAVEPLPAPVAAQRQRRLDLARGQAWVLQPQERLEVELPRERQAAVVDDDWQIQSPVGSPA